MTYLCLSFSLSWLMLSPWSCWGFGWPHLKLTPSPPHPSAATSGLFYNNLSVCLWGGIRQGQSVRCDVCSLSRRYLATNIQLISSVSFVAIPPTSCSGCYASRAEYPVACGRKLLKTLLIRIIYYGKCYDSEAASVNCHENSVTYSIVPFWGNMGIWHSGCGMVPGEYLYVKWIWNGAFYAECTCLINKSVWREMMASLKNLN